MITLGADPECWIKDAKGMIVPASGLIPGTKDKPHPVKNGAIQVDGLAAEFNIDPASCADEFVYNIETVKAQLQDILNEHDKGYTLAFYDTVKFMPSHFKAFPAESKVIGCDPDFIILKRYSRNHNKYLVSEMQREVPYMPDHTRFAGGHVHVGGIYADYDDDASKTAKRTHIVNTFESRMPNVWQAIKNRTDKEVDRVTYENTTRKGVAATMDYNGGTRRYSEYESQICYRPKSYGIELRNFPNFWVANPDFIKRVWDYTMEGVLKALFTFHHVEDVSPLNSARIPKDEQVKLFDYIKSDIASAPYQFGK